MSEHNGSEPAQEPAWLVVVGASAGGIQALTGLLEPLTTEFPAPIVIAQHLQPSRASHLASIFGARTKAQVVTVEVEEPLRAGRVYLVPSDRHVTITDHQVGVTPAGGDRPAPSIDRLLASAAETFGERLIAVILSGMGSDGVAGARAVKAAGGTVIIQDPATASHPDLPRALPPNLVDFVVGTERMGELLVQIVQASAPRAAGEDVLVTAFLDQVRERTGIDFSAYKRGTVLRRLQRRMIATGNDGVESYARHAARHPEEYQRLASAFLIKLTEFFRDPDLFQHLREQVIPELIEEARGHGRELRIWSAGCATGEEAYSLALLFADALGEESDLFTIRIFATDLDEDAIGYARRGVYPKAAVAGVPEDLLDRWFTRTRDDFEIHKGVRQLVVFGQHDLGQRAPFPRIDLALCRNVLIYFTPELQSRALQLFAFALRPGGYMVLGKAESVTPHSEHFTSDHPRLKLYRRTGTTMAMPTSRIRSAAPLPVPVTRRGPAGWLGADGRQPGAGRTHVAVGADRPDQLMLQLPIGVVLINPGYQITFINAAARRLLGIRGEGVGQDFIHLTPALSSDDLREAVASALAGEAVTLVRSVALDAEFGAATLRVTLQPQGSGDGPPVAVLITVINVTEEARQLEVLRAEIEHTRTEFTLAREGVDRLTKVNRSLVAANEELANVNAILRSGNEELLIANEEVQAATEEVETLNEELQASNEELETLNEELQATVEELNTTNEDLEAQSTALAESAASLQEQRQQSELERVRLGLILDGMGEAVMVLDRNAQVVATNRSYDEVFGGPDAAWSPQDAAGRELPPDDWPQARAGRGESFTMAFSLTSAHGERRWFEATSRGESLEWGAVVVIRDISDRSLRHLQELFIAAAGHELQTPIAALRMSLQVLDRDGRDHLGPGTAHYLDVAVGQARHLGVLASRLFDMSIARHGRLVVAQEEVDLRELVRDVLDTLKLAHPDAKLAVRLGPDAMRVAGDELRLRQLITNIVGNAMTHGASSSPVTVTLQADREAKLLVADRGPGLPASVRAHMYAPFAAGDESGRPSLGLGLYLAHAIAEQHAGTLEIQDRHGGGTQVTVRLPLHEGPGQDAPPKATGRRRSRSTA